MDDLLTILIRIPAVLLFSFVCAVLIGQYFRWRNG